jgi:hypothetical protein
MSTIIWKERKESVNSNVQNIGTIPTVFKGLKATFHDRDKGKLACFKFEHPTEPEKYEPQFCILSKSLNRQYRDGVVEKKHLLKLPVYFIKFKVNEGTEKEEDAEGYYLGNPQTEAFDVDTAGAKAVAFETSFTADEIAGF